MQEQQQLGQKNGTTTEEIPEDLKKLGIEAAEFILGEAAIPDDSSCGDCWICLLRQEVLGAESLDDLDKVMLSLQIVSVLIKAQAFILMKDAD